MGDTATKTLPPGWRMVRFEQMAECVADRVEPAETDLDYYVGLEHLDPESLKIRRWGSPNDVIGTKLRFKPGDIIFGKRRFYQRKLAVAEREGICSAHAMVLRAREETVLPEFLPFFMQSDEFFERAMSISMGSLSPTISWKTLARQEFVIPPEDEQRRIAKILWAADDALLSFNKALDEILALKRVFWINKVANRDWSSVPLEDVSEIASGSTPNRKVDRYWHGGTIPWLTTHKVNDKIITSADEFITNDALKECSLNLFPSGTTLVALYGEGKTRGSAAYLSIEACINQAFACISPNSRVDKWYLYYCIDNYYEKLRTFSQGSNQKNLSSSILSKFLIPLPKKDEQVEIAGVFKKLDDRSHEIEKHIIVLKELKSSLLSQIFNLYYSSE